MGLFIEGCEVEMIFQKLAKEVQTELEQSCGFDFSDWTITYELNGRFRTTLGDCAKNIITKTAHIRVHKGLFTEGHYDNVRQTIAHELVHVVQTDMGHGNGFKRLANVVNQNTSYSITRTSPNPAAIRPVYKYVIVCQDCGSKTYRTRASKSVKHPELFHCRCGGKLKVEANK